MRKLAGKRIFTILLVITASVTFLTGCASKNKSTDKAASAAESTTAPTDTEKKQEDKKVTPVVAAVMGTTNGYAYVDDKNELVGYNVDVLKAVFAKLPQYELSFKITDFQSIFSGIDSGIYQIGAQAFIANPQRREKYIFTDSFGKYIFKIATAADNTTIKSWKDLGGLTTEDIVGDGPVAIVEAFNKDYPDNPINLQFVDSTDGSINHLADKKIDFQISSTTTTQLRAKEYGLENAIKFVPFGDGAPDYFNSNQYFGFLISKTNQQLADDFNKVLEELIQAGTIKELSIKWFQEPQLAVSVQEATDFRDAK